MKQIGILFKAEMVRAILDGRKTLTSRLSGLEKINKSPSEWDLCESNGGDAPDVFLWWNGSTHDFKRIKCPYGQPGDVLIGRECWAPNEPNSGTIYRADGECHGVKWRSAMLMPWKFSRLRLEVVRVWPSRLQDMTEEMANMEGCPSHLSVQTLTPALADYAELWDSINAKSGHPWNKNEWVWRIEFRRTK